MKTCFMACKLAAVSMFPDVDRYMMYVFNVSAEWLRGVPSSCGAIASTAILRASSLLT
jgi:hypothetical protein